MRLIRCEYDTLGTVMHGAAFQWLPSVPEVGQMQTMLVTLGASIGRAVFAWGGEACPCVGFEAARTKPTRHLHYITHKHGELGTCFLTNSCIRISWLPV
jgi:hypothetical protein